MKYNAQAVDSCWFDHKDHEQIGRPLLRVSSPAKRKNPKNHSVTTVYIHTISQPVTLACTLLSLQTKPARRRQHKRHWLQNEQMSLVFERPLTSNVLMTSFVFLSPHDITAGDIVIGRFSINSCNSLIGAKWNIPFSFAKIHVRVWSNQGLARLKKLFQSGINLVIYSTSWAQFWVFMAL